LVATLSSVSASLSLAILGSTTAATCGVQGFSRWLV
jgi:hypothetical protein